MTQTIEATAEELISEDDAARDELQRKLVQQIGVLALEHDWKYRAIRNEMMVRTLNLRWNQPPRTFTQQDSNRMEDLILDAATEIWKIQAAIGPAVHARARVIALAMAGVAASDPQAIQVLALSGHEADEFLRPIFAAGGIADRYMSDWEEEFVLPGGGTLAIEELTDNSVAYFLNETSMRLGDMTPDDCARLTAEARSAGRALGDDATAAIEEHLAYLTRRATFALEEPR